MLQGIIRNTLRVRLGSLLQRQLQAITSSKTLVEKKKHVYQSQVKPVKQKQTPAAPNQSQKDKQERKDQFQLVLVDLGKDLVQYLNFKMGADPKTIDISPILRRHQVTLLKQYSFLEALELINYVEIVKNLCLTRLEHVENIDAAYAELQTFLSSKEHQDVLERFFKSLWAGGVPTQYQIRTVGLLQFMSEETRKEYLLNIVPLMRYFKSTEILVLLFEKWRLGYEYPYEVIDQIHHNQYYFSMEDINSSYWKMLFVESIKGQFIGNDDGIYSKILGLFKDKPNILAHAAFHKFVKILQSQGYFVQGEVTRQHLENSLNMFINIAKNQNYGQNSMTLGQLVELYLGFEETNATGQTLLTEITFLSKTTNFHMTSDDLPLYRKLLENVLKNIRPVLKYERIDYLNKEYTYDSINFLNEFLPKYIALWPEVIFEVNDAIYELFPSNKAENPLLRAFIAGFEKAVEARKSDLGLQHLQYTLKVLRFLITHKKSQIFTIETVHLQKILVDFLNIPIDQKISNEQLEAVYLAITLLGDRCVDSKFKPLIHRLNSEFVEVLMSRELEREDSSYIKSYDHNIVWLALLSARIKSHGFSIDESVVEVFVNERLFYMINSLKYLQVYELLVYVLGLQRLNIEIYSRLLSNLSTFVIYTNEKTTRKHGVTSFFLNHRYIDYYFPICRLVLDNKSIFRKVQDKQSFKVVQIMISKNVQSLSNVDILNFLQILGDPSFLNISLNKHIEDIKFTAAQLQNFQYSSALRYFEYYNKSLLRYFQGKYNESEVKSRLRGGSLSSAEIEEFFSKIEVYKTIIMDGELNIRFELPEPKTSIPDFKYMYACQKIYQKIETSNHFTFHEDVAPEERGRITEVQLDQEKEYINRELLFLEDSENQFRIENRSLPRYIKMEIWESYVFFQKNCLIEPRDLFLNSKKLTDEILNKIIKGVFGKYEKIREVVKEFSAYHHLLTLLNDQQLRYSQHGAALEFRREGEEQASLTLLCTNNTNYKILYICGYFMAKHGGQVIVLREDDPMDEVCEMVKEQFPAVRTQEESQKEEEDVEG